MLTSVSIHKFIKKNKFKTLINGLVKNYLLETNSFICLHEIPSLLEEGIGFDPSISIIKNLDVHDFDMHGLMEGGITFITVNFIRFFVSISDTSKKTNYQITKHSNVSS